MQEKYKNVTISLPIETARAIRIEAAKAGLSTSAYIAGILGHQLEQLGQYEAALENFVARKPYINNAGARYPTRAELYDE